MSKPQEYQEKITTIKSALEMLDYSEQYDGHRYHTFQKELVTTMKKVLTDDELNATEKDRLFKIISIVIGHYIDCLEDYDELVPMVEELLAEGKIDAGQWNYFKDQLVYNP